MKLALTILAGCLAGSSVAMAGVPLTLTLVKAHGTGAVTVGAATTHLRSRVWLVRSGGEGVARGSAEVLFRTGSSGDTVRFSFPIALRVALRGY